MKTFKLSSVAATMLLASSAHADVWTSAGSSNGGGYDYQSAVNGTVRSDMSWTATYVGYSASAIASHGILKTYTAGSADGNTGIVSDATAAWRDWVTIDGGAWNGSKGLATFSMAYNYTLTGEVFPDIDNPQSGKLARAGFNLDMSVYTGSTSRAYVVHDQHVSYAGYYGTPGITVSDYFGTTYPEPTGLVSLTAEFTFGTPFLLSAQMGVWGGAGWSSTGFAQYESDAFHSSYWGGINNVTAGGLAFNDYVLTSASGTNYGQSMVPSEIPEPSSIALLIVGMLCGAAAVRRGTIT